MIVFGLDFCFPGFSNKNENVSVVRSPKKKFLFYDSIMIYEPPQKNIMPSNILSSANKVVQCHCIKSKLSFGNLLR